MDENTLIKLRYDLIVATLRDGKVNNYTEATKMAEEVYNWVLKGPAVKWDPNKPPPH